jgi:hypothetical protein
MEKETIKENLGLLPEIKTAIAELKALFSTDKKEEVKPEVAPEVKPEPVVEAKVEFNHEEFTKNFNDYKTSNEAKLASYDEKIVAFEAQLKAANETITKQADILAQTFALVEKLAEAPVALSKQVAKEGVRKDARVADYEAEMAEWRNKYMTKA